MIDGNAYGMNSSGRYDPELIAHYAKGRADHGAEMSESLKRAASRSARAPVSQPGLALAGSAAPGGPAPAPGARATETLGDLPRPTSNSSPTAPTRTTTVEDSRRIGPILVRCGQQRCSAAQGGLLLHM